MPSSKSAASTGRPPVPAAGGQGLCGFSPEGENPTVVSCLFCQRRVGVDSPFISPAAAPVTAILLRFASVARSRERCSLSLVLSSPLLHSRSFYSTISPRVYSFAREVAPGYRACENPGDFLFIKFLFSLGSVFCGIVFFGVEVEGEQQREAGKEEKEEEEEEEENCRSVEEGTSLL